MANHDLSNVATSALKRELERRGWTVHLENGPTAGPSFFERLGDNVHHLLPFLEVRSLCRLDAAMTSREGRETAWLPRLAGLESADLVLKEVGRLYKVDHRQPDTYDPNAAAWLAALRWLVARGVPMPERLECPHRCDASQFTACFEHCTTAGSVRHISMYSCSGALTAAVMMHLQRCTGLTSLNLGRRTVDQAVWEQLDAQNWTCFDILENFYLDNYDVAHHPISITTAEIWGRRFIALVNISIHCRNDGSLEHICKIQTLQDVSLHLVGGAETAAGLAGLEQLIKLPVLQGLQINNCNFIDAAIGHIKGITTLRDLSFYDGGGLSAAGIVLIAERFGLLEKLTLFECTTVTDADLAVLSRLTSLQNLGLYGQEDVTDAGVAHLRALTCLQDLGLTNIRITSESLSVIGSLTQLRELNLSGCHIFDDDSATVHLRSLTNLTSLDVTCSGFTDAGLDSLQSAANLESLTLGDEYREGEWLITGPALERLVAACTKLEELDFLGPKAAKLAEIISPTFQAVLDRRGIVVYKDYDYDSY